MKQTDFRIQLACGTGKALNIEIDVGMQVDFVQENYVGTAEHMRVFVRLVVTFSNGRNDDSHRFPEVEERGANEVTDVFDQYD
jgi:hypothetical protein